MSIYNCELTDQEFFLSDKEESFFIRRNLDLPSKTEIERLRSILSLVPQPLFGTIGLDPINGGTNITGYRNLADHGAPYPETQEDFFISDFPVFKKLFLKFFTSASLTDQVINYGNPLVYGSTNVECCFDCNFCTNCKNCYQVMLSSNCENVFYSRFVNECSNSYFLENCNNCSNCLFCSNVQDQEYLIFNKKVDKEIFHKILFELSLHSSVRLEQAIERFENFLVNQPIFETQDSKSFRRGFPLENLKDGATFYSKNCRICSSSVGCDGLENSYACFGCTGKFTNCHNSGLLLGSGQEIFRSFSCFGKNENLDFCIACEDSSDLFCCYGLKNRSYCIFNKQLSKTDYKKNLNAIRNVFKSEGFSIALLFDQAKLFPYNHSMAEILFPINKVQAEMMGYLWDSSKDSVKIPDSDNDGLICTITGVPFQISSEEIDFFKQNNLANPVRSPQQRFQDRMSIMNLAPRNVTQCAVTGIPLLNWQQEKRVSLSQKAFKKISKERKYSED